MITVPANSSKGPRRRAPCLNSHKIATWASGLDMEVLSRQTFHSTKEISGSRGKEPSIRSQIWLVAEVRQAPVLLSTGALCPSVLSCNFAKAPLLLPSCSFYDNVGAQAMSPRPLSTPLATMMAPVGSAPSPSPLLPLLQPTCCELGGRGLALVGPTDGTDPHLIARTGPQGLH